jgi:hypothetical protein
MSPEEEPVAHTEEAGEEGFQAGAAADRILYRAMREDPAGGPMVGPTARTLGARPHVDILVVAGQVRPNTGGMSVAPYHPGNLHPLRRLVAYGGSGKDPVWYITVAALGNDLQFRQDSATHGVIEPARPMSLDDFQKALEATRPNWTKLP